MISQAAGWKAMEYMYITIESDLSPLLNDKLKIF